MESLVDIKTAVSRDGEKIRWAGSVPSGPFVVMTETRDGILRKRICDPLSWDPDTERQRTVSFVENNPEMDAGVLISPSDSTQMSQSRRAAVFGVNIGGDCTSGACKKYHSIGGCTLSYDIETNMDKTREGGFGLVDEEILSIAAKCSCSLEFYVDRSAVADSAVMVSRFVAFVVDHMPLWTVGWNCYGFDNECMRYWCTDELKDLFTVTRVGAFGKASYGSIIDIPGIYNVDVMVYMNKSLYKLPSFKLAHVAEYMNVSRKTEMPEMTENVDPGELRAYNMNDCVVVLDIWKREKLEHTIPSLALCTASPVYDCCRYVTGTMAPLGYSSYLMSKGIGIRWGECTEPQNYAGGFVMEPVRGVHENVVVCDFSSMYPTIIASCNIDPHTVDITYLKHDRIPGTVRVTDSTTTVWLDGRTATFNNTTKSPICEFMSFLISERSSYKKTNPMYASSLKVLANSLYGSLGYSKSAVYSPSCAAAITAIGRYCVKMAREYLSVEPLLPVYGDTDSVMTSSVGSKDFVLSLARDRLDALHCAMSSTTLSMMRMEVEEYYKKGMMMDKKRYCMLRENGTVKNVGISVARKDVSVICKQAAYVTIDSMFKDTRQETVDGISRFVFAVSQMAVNGKFTLRDVSRYVKKDGVSGYQYPSVTRGKVFIQEEKARLWSSADVDVSILLNTISKEIERFTLPCGIGRVSDITKAASTNSW